MKRFLKIFLPILLALAVLFSVGWYLLRYDPGFTRDILLSQARAAEERGDHSTATWFYNLAYKQSGEDEAVAIELAEQYKSAGNYTKAEYTLSNAIADGGTMELYMALCKAYVEQDKLLDAVTMLDNVADPEIKAQLDAIRPNAPAGSPEPGYFNQYISVALTGSEGTIYYTTNREYPSSKNAPYATPFALTGGETTIYALSIGENGLVSRLSILGYTVAGVIEEVTIDDAELDKIIRQQLQVSNDHKLYSNELWSITELEITSEVKSLSDLSLMPFIERLVIQEGEYSDLNTIGSLASLKELSIHGLTLSNDEIKTIASLNSLTSLTLSKCTFTGISGLENATGLRYLDLNNNTIRELNVLSGMMELEYLDLSNNAVTDLTALSSLTKLKELRLSYNAIASTAPLAGCTDLKILHIDHNALTSLEGLEKLAGLSELYAGFNQIATVSNLASGTELTQLDLANNVLTDIQALSTLKKLTVFDFSNNQVTKLPTFSTDCSLIRINGTNNQLTSLDALKGLGQLNYVIMENNAGITSVAPLASCYSLIEVNVYGTGVTDASALTSMNVIVKYTPIGI